MKVFVTGRRMGKTSALVAWLLKGQPIPEYPGWSRAIVCANHATVVHTTRMVRDAMEAQNITGDERWICDMRKAVWSVGDLSTALRGAAVNKVEFAFDNAELVLEYYLSGRKPAIITMTGELFDASASATTST